LVHRGSFSGRIRNLMCLAQSPPPPPPPPASPGPPPAPEPFAGGIQSLLAIGQDQSGKQRRKGVKSVTTQRNPTLGNMGLNIPT
jgi:hypothetical protein